MNGMIFIDDSGSKLWDTPYTRDFVTHPPVRSNDNRSFWLNNYFVLAGVYFDEDTIRKLNPYINEKKTLLFGTKYVELHSSCLRNPHQRHKQYTAKYGVSDDALKDFVDNVWYPILEDNPQIKIQAVVLDKRYYKNQRARSPLALATQALFDRIELGPNKTSKIVFDQMDVEVQSAKRDQGTILQIANNEIDLGAFFNTYSHASIDFERSSISNFLQIADTVAYNILRQFVDYGNNWDSFSASSKMYPYFERIYNNFYSSGASEYVRGSGIIKLPDPVSFTRD